MLLRRWSLCLSSRTNESNRLRPPDHDARFRHINDVVKAAIATQEPVISVDTQKKQLVGEVNNGGREWHAVGEPVKVNTHDFPRYAEGMIPYRVYGPAANGGFFSVGITADTA